MCGIFGAIRSINNVGKISRSKVLVLAEKSLERGRDACGLINLTENQLSVYRSDGTIDKLIRDATISIQTQFIFGHSRLITNGMAENQPVIKDDIYLVHNGIIANIDEAWKHVSSPRQMLIDSEIICSIINEYYLKHTSFDGLLKHITSICFGVINIAVYIPAASKIILLSNLTKKYIFIII